MLLQHPKVIPHGPVLHDLAVGKTPPVHVLNCDTSSGRRDASELPLVGSAEDQASHHLVSFGDYVLDIVTETREGGEYPPDRFLESIDAMLQFRYCLMVENVRV